MNKLRRISFVLLPVMMYVLPLWITFGKVILFGVGGWLMFMSLFTVVPLLFISLLLFRRLLMTRSDVRTTGKVGTLDAVLLISVYVSVFLHSLFIVDGGDTEGSVNSVATKYLSLPHSLSGQISSLLLAVACISIVCSFLFFMYEKRKEPNLKQ